MEETSNISKSQQCGEGLSVICIGGANIDTKIQSLAWIRPGTSNPSRVTRSAGGVARNVAANLALLGQKTALVAFTGADPEGEWLLRETESLGVDCSRCRSLPDSRTGSYTAFLDQDGEMFVAAVDMALYDRIEKGQMEEISTNGSFTGAFFLDTNLPSEVIEFLLKEGCRRALPLIVDPVSTPKTGRLPRNLEGIDWLLPNWDEAVCLAGMKNPSLDEYPEVCSRILGRGAKGVIVTLGSEGIAAAQREGFRCRIEATPTAVVDVTGAGDSFAAGFIFGLVSGEPLLSSCHLGMTASRLTIQSHQSVCPELSRSLLYRSLREWERNQG